MPMGSRHCVTGMLMQSARGLVVEVDGGGTYALDAPGSARKLLGQRVTVEGTRSGFDRLDVDRISPAQPR